MKVRIIYSVMILAFAFSVTIPTLLVAEDVSPQGVYRTTTAYRVGVAFWTQGINPHYGAFFSGGWGRNQHYRGPGGDAATCSSGSGCIGGWNWHGAALSTLLIPKLWYFSGSAQRTASNYQADMFYDA